MGPGAAVRRRWRASAFAPVLASPVLRRLLPALAVSAVGDGMSAVGVAWLAIRIAAPADRGLVVGVAVAAYSLPGAAGAVLLARPLRKLAGRRLVAADATLRAVTLALIPVLYAFGALAPGLYVALLAASSLLHAWGISGQYTLVAEHLPPEARTAGNALLSTFGAVAYVVGPLLAGLVVATAGPAVPIAADAASFAALAVTAATARRNPRPTASPPTGAGEASGNPRTTTAVGAAEASGIQGMSAAAEAAEANGDPGMRAAAEAAEANGNPGMSAATEVGEPDRALGFAVIARSRPLAGLLVLTLIYYFLYGPVEVALPLYVTGPLHGGAGLLGLFWFVFGIGATAGSLTAGLARRLPLWPVLVVAVIGWGAALVPLGLLRLPAAALACFAAGGLLYAPYPALSATLFQRESPPALLSQVLAARGALTVLASPLGTALGGPLTSWLGAQHTLLVSAAATIAVGLATAAILTAARQRTAPRPPA